MPSKPLPPTARGPRSRPDRCPGILRPWPAEDGALIRIRLVGGHLSREQLGRLGDLSARYGDGDLHLTARANLQIRGVALPVPATVVAETTAMGLLPSATHERVRNIMVSPLTGRLGGLADLRPVATKLDAAVRSEPALAALPARFLFCLDDRGELTDRAADLAAVAVGPDRVRLWAGGLPGDVVALTDAAPRLVELACSFLDLRGAGPSACWHVRELPGGGADLGPFQPTSAGPPVPPPPGPPPYGCLVQDDGRHARHLDVPAGRVGPALTGSVLGQAGDEVVVTPWRSLLLPDLEAA
jgi:precorrin-3B synthase